jgi:5-bromo-4-chloroindolyl phosphate hydrolysis protein
VHALVTQLFQIVFKKNVGNINAIRKNPKRFFKKTKTWLGSNVFLLYVLPFPLVLGTLKAFATGNLLAILVNTGGYAAFIVAAKLLRSGLQAETVYREKRVANPPRWPLKTFSALIVAITTFVIALLGAKQAFFVSMAFGTGAFLGMFLSYGFDPRKQKKVIGSHGYTIEEINSVIEEAENIILGIESANNNISNHEFNDRIDRICEIARTILNDLETNPGAIRRARKFLLIYLQGANKVTTGYANTHQQTESFELERNFRNILESIETVFKDQKNKLLEEDLFDLDVQIEVLAKQLKHEGLV